MKVFTAIIAAYLATTTAAFKLGATVEHHLLLVRQTCDANTTLCGGTVCLPAEYTCCPDNNAICGEGTVCQLGSDGAYGCCESGSVCTGAAGDATSSLSDFSGISLASTVGNNTMGATATATATATGTATATATASLLGTSQTSTASLSGAASVSAASSRASSASASASSATASGSGANGSAHGGPAGLVMVMGTVSVLVFGAMIWL